MRNTIFLTLSQFLSEKGLKAKRIVTLDKPLFTKTLEDGTKVDVQGAQLVDANNNPLEDVALAKSLNGKSSKELGQMAKNLSIAQQSYDHITEDGDTEVRTMYILCPTWVRTNTGDFADLLF